MASGQRPAANDSDVFVAAYAREETRKWVRLFGTAGPETATEIVTDTSGRIHVSGGTTDALGGQTHEGEYDAYVATFATSGSRTGPHLFGTPDLDLAEGIAAGPSDTVYPAGRTRGDLGGKATSRGWNGFVCAYQPSDGDGC